MALFEALLDHVERQGHSSLLIVVGIVILVGEIQKVEGDVAAILVLRPFELGNQLETNLCGRFDGFFLGKVVLRVSVEYREAGNMAAGWPR